MKRTLMADSISEAIGRVQGFEWLENDVVSSEPVKPKKVKRSWLSFIKNMFPWTGKKV